MNQTSNFVKKNWITPQISGVSAMNQAMGKDILSVVEGITFGSPTNQTTGPAS